jgi:hypothetical protein
VVGCATEDSWLWKRLGRIAGKMVAMYKFPDLYRIAICKLHHTNRYLDYYLELCRRTLRRTT